MSICTTCKIKEHNKKIFTECDKCLSKSIYEISKKLTLEAFPEMNGLPNEEPKNPYAKIIRNLAGDWK